MKKDKPDIYLIVFWLVFCLLFVLVPILWLIPMPFGTSVEFTVYYEDSAYFTNEKAIGIDILLDGVYYGTTDAFGVLEIRMSDQENHTITIHYNGVLVYEYLVEYDTEINIVDVFLPTKSLEAEFTWNKVGEQDSVVGVSFELWYNRAGAFELVGTRTTDSLGMILFDGLIMGEYKECKMYFYSYKFVGIDYEIPVVLIEFNQTTAFKSIDLLVEPITVMFDFDYSDSLIFGTDYPIEGLTSQLWVYQFVEYIFADGSIPELYYTVVYDWVLISTQTTDVEGRTYFYNLETHAVWGYNSPSGDHGWYYSDEYKLTWSYDGVNSEQIFNVGDDLDFFNELSCKEVVATFNWDVDGYPLATNVDVFLNFLDGTHTPMMFTTDMNGQLTISGLIMGNYDLEGAVFECIQSQHSKVIPQILFEPTKGMGILKDWFNLKNNTNPFISEMRVPGFLSFSFFLILSFLASPHYFFYINGEFADVNLPRRNHKKVK